MPKFPPLPFKPIDTDLSFLLVLLLILLSVNRKKRKSFVFFPFSYFCTRSRHYCPFYFPRNIHLLASSTEWIIHLFRFSSPLLSFLSVISLGGIGSTCFDVCCFGGKPTDDVKPDRYLVKLTKPTSLFGAFFRT